VDRLLGKRSKVIEKLYFDRSELDMFEETFVIRIGEGCNCRCTFCSHRNAIGPYKSKDEAECIKEFKLGYKNGYRIFRITSMDTGRYGLDIKSSLPGLLNKFLAEADDVEFILEDINPLWINKYGEKLIDLAGLKKIRVLQAPVQSGSAGVLKKMRRWADVDKLKKLLLAIKGANPAMIFATEILIGFPTETEDDFLMTMRFLEDTNIDYSYVYPYYENKNMESSKIYPKCSRDVIDKRLDNAIKYFDENKISYSVFLNI
jgi:tRNA A37 methylthiotransferase MiaB